VADQLHDGNPTKKAGLDFVLHFEAKHGAGSRSLFAATAWDALKGLKDHVGSQAVFTMSPTDHNGVVSRSQVMVRIEGGAWKLQS
jgi:branched-chain amino acid transport system substrate-binding protein